MNKKAVILLSGGLDSTLAACIVKEQGIDVYAINFQTMFGCCKDDARGVAYELGIPFTMLKVGDDYLKVIQNPKYGYGKGINPCVDCRIYMFELGKKYMDEIGASFLISGEVLGQRPMSQKMRDFVKIEKDLQMEGLILRPLSSKLMPITKMEEAGIVDRSKLYGIQGRSRTKLVELAHKYKVKDIPQPSTGCALTDPGFAKKVQDIFDHEPDYKRWEFEMLKFGRHFRLDDKAKVILAKDGNENAYLEGFDTEGTFQMDCENFAGPRALIVGKRTPERVEAVAKLMLRYGRKPLPESTEIAIHDGEEKEVVPFNEQADEALVDALRVT